jgi:prepilin-type N-terminal cleavage/methylation domain-containing protein
MINNRYKKKGLTLIELLVAMIVTSIIATAVVTLAYALDTANDISDDTSEKQAQIRFAAIRISELIRHSRLVCYAGSDDLAVWRADDDNDNQISISELAYIECGSAHDHLRICEFQSSNSTAINISSIGTFASNWWSAYSADVNYTNMMPQCSVVDFGFLPALPPQGKFVTISFEVVENGIARQCQINATLHGWAGNLLDEGGNIVSDDD